MSDYAWGPYREVFSSQANRVVLNSATNNPGVGDERNFVRVRELASGLAWTDSVLVVPGGRYEVYIYFRNNGAPDMIARGVRVQSNFEKYLREGEPAGVKAAVYAENAKPEVVWDSARFQAQGGATLALRYIEGSAELHTMGAANNSAIMGMFKKGGALVGFDKLDGVIAGGMDQAGYVTYEVEAEKVGGGVTIDYAEIYGAELAISGVGDVGSSGNGGGTTQGVVNTNTGSLPQTGMGWMAMMMPVLMGVLVMGLGWRLLRKNKKCDKIR